MFDLKNEGEGVELFNCLGIGCRGEKLRNEEMKGR